MTRPQLRLLVLFPACSFVCICVGGVVSATRATESNDASHVASRGITESSQDDDDGQTSQQDQSSTPDESKQTDESSEDNATTGQDPDENASQDENDDSQPQDPTVPGTELRQRMQQPDVGPGALPTRRELPTLELKAKIISTNGSASVVIKVDEVVHFLQLESNSMRDAELPRPSQELPSDLLDDSEFSIELLEVSPHKVVVLLQPYGDVVVLY